MSERSQVQIFGGPAPKTWADYREGCLATYGGGYRDADTIEAFRHGMETIFNLLEREKFACIHVDELPNPVTASEATAPVETVSSGLLRYSGMVSPLNQRLLDLVRYTRHTLHTSGLISDDEYFELAKDHAAVKRLEDYDAAIAKIRSDATAARKQGDLAAITDVVRLLRRCCDDPGPEVSAREALLSMADAIEGEPRDNKSINPADQATEGNAI